MDSFNYVMSEFAFPVDKLLLLLVGKLTVVLILIEGYEIFVADFNVIPEKVLDVTFSELDVAR